MFSQRQRPVIYHPGTFHHRWKSHTSRPLKLVIDGDPGIDDCHAILIALASPHVQLLGITCVAGNTSVDNGVRNSHYLLHACQRHDVPVFRGASHSVDGQQYFKPHIHGEDGFGNITFNKTIPLDLLGRESAPEALVRLAHQYRGELVIAAIGPLTNLYWAHRLDPEFSRNIKRLYMMGGNFPMEIPGFRSGKNCIPLAEQC